MVPDTRRAALVSGAALVAALINGAYILELASRFADATLDASARQVVESGLTLALAWTGVLLWVAVHPRRGRFLLPFTGLAIVLGNVLHSYSMVRFNGVGWGAALINMAVGVAFAGLFGLAYRAGASRSTPPMPAPPT